MILAHVTLDRLDHLVGHAHAEQPPCTSDAAAAQATCDCEASCFALRTEEYRENERRFRGCHIEHTEGVCW